MRNVTPISTQQLVRMTRFSRDLVASLLLGSLLDVCLIRDVKLGVHLTNLLVLLSQYTGVRLLTLSRVTLPNLSSSSLMCSWTTSLLPFLRAITLPLLTRCALSDLVNIMKSACYFRST